MWIQYKMKLLENISLKQLHTFRMNVNARFFSSFSNVEDLNELLAFSSQGKGLRNMILGGGSNVLFTKDFDGLILKNEIMGIEKVREDEDHIYVRTGAGESWHLFVLYCLEHNYYGVENMALIPGHTGAAPMQNIGAYGVEIKDVFYSLEAMNIADGQIVEFLNNDCQFAYRESVFKNKYKGRFVITSVTYRLNKKPNYHIEYGAIKQELDRMKATTIDAKLIAQAVMNIRRSKLPDPNITGSAGSFFKNPEVDEQKFLSLKNEFPDIVGHPSIEGRVKLAAGWLIEKCGWKGFRNGDAGCHPAQALVLVNYGNAQGSDIMDMAIKIKAEVQSTFGVLLEEEVNIIG